MNILLIEDEFPAYKRLQKMLLGVLPAARIAPQIESISAAVKYLQSNPLPELIFLDIQLADGLSFSIFDQVDISCPIIFTTAFDQYAIKAFKLHSIDYLLKPIDAAELDGALEKFRHFYQQKNQFSPEVLQRLVQQMQRPVYRERFLVKSGSGLNYLTTAEVAWFYSDQSLVFAKKADGKQHHLDTTLDQLAQQLDPAAFFRINRKFIVSLPAIRKIDTYFNGRLLLTLHPASETQATVSRDRVRGFKKWLGG